MVRGLLVDRSNPLNGGLSDLGEIAERGLANCLPDDLDKLQPLLQQIEDGRSPADDLLDAWSKDPSPESVLRAVAY